MRYTTFGRRTGLRVSEVALGTATDDQLGRLDEASAVPLGIAHESIVKPEYRAIVSGGVHEVLDAPRIPVA